MDAQYMKNFFVAQGASTVPKGKLSIPTFKSMLKLYHNEDFDDDTPVVVCPMNNQKAGEIFGVTKIKNGNRYSTFDLDSMSVILYPRTKKAQVYVSI